MPLRLHGLHPSPSSLRNLAGSTISNRNVDICTTFPHSHVSPSRASPYSETDCWPQTPPRSVSLCLPHQHHTPFPLPFVTIALPCPLDDIIFQGHQHKLFPLLGMCFLPRKEASFFSGPHYWNLTCRDAHSKEPPSTFTCPHHTISDTGLPMGHSPHLWLPLLVVMFVTSFSSMTAGALCSPAWHRVGMAAQRKPVEWEVTVINSGHPESKGQEIVASVPDVSCALNQL